MTSELMICSKIARRWHSLQTPLMSSFLGKASREEKLLKLLEMQSWKSSQIQNLKKWHEKHFIDFLHRICFYTFLAKTSKDRNIKRKINVPTLCLHWNKWTPQFDSNDKNVLPWKNKKIKLCENPLVQCQAFQFLRDSGNNVANSKRMKSVDILNLV